MEPDKRNSTPAVARSSGSQPSTLSPVPATVSVPAHYVVASTNLHVDPAAKYEEISEVGKAAFADILNSQYHISVPEDAMSTQIGVPKGLAEREAKQFGAFDASLLVQDKPTHESGFTGQYLMKQFALGKSLASESSNQSKSATKSRRSSGSSSASDTKPPTVEELIQNMQAQLDSLKRERIEPLEAQVKEQAKTIKEQAKTIEEQAKTLKEQAKTIEEQAKTLKEQGEAIEILKSSNSELLVLKHAVIQRQVAKTVLETYRKDRELASGNAFEQNDWQTLVAQLKADLATTAAPCFQEADLTLMLDWIQQGNSLAHPSKNRPGFLDDLRKLGQVEGAPTESIARIVAYFNR